MSQMSNNCRLWPMCPLQMTEGTICPVFPFHSTVVAVSRRLCLTCRKRGEHTQIHPASTRVGRVSHRLDLETELVAVLPCTRHMVFGWALAALDDGAVFTVA